MKLFEFVLKHAKYSTTLSTQVLIRLSTSKIAPTEAVVPPLKI